MVFFKNTIPLAITSISIFYLSLVEVSSLVISDDRARNLDVTPVLGRGYSLGTNSFQSTCLTVDETTTPSYNYDYMFTEMTGRNGGEAQSAVELSFAYDKIKDRLNKQTRNSHLIVASMRIERYYNSLREESSPLTDDAMSLLDTQDYIGFFKSCGPSYVRSIRRAQELTAMFQYDAPSEAASNDFTAGLQGSGLVGDNDDNFDFAGKTKFKSVTKSLSITIIGYGLGLNHEGSGSLTSTNLAEFNTVMKFAFKSFTTSENTAFVGMIYGIEIVPWVENTSFQVAAKLGDEDIIIPLGKSLIPKVIPRVPGSTVAFTNNAAGRVDNFKCKHGPFYIDKYGYCCEGAFLYNTVTNEYEEEAFNVTSSTMICRPSRSLDKSMVKNNMINNAEFVARLDSIIRYRLNTLATLEQCVSSINSFDPRFYPTLLKAQATVKSDVLTHRITVLELKLALDPFSDYSLITEMGKELDEFLEMYYQPCIAALFGANVGTSPDVEPMYFMAYGWLQHPECSKISCLADNMRWDRENGGCVASVITGGSPNTGTDALNCKRNDLDECEYSAVDLEKLQTATQTCWGGQVAPTALMRSFCLPQLTSDVVSAALAAEQLVTKTACESAGALRFSAEGEGD